MLRIHSCLMGKLQTSQGAPESTIEGAGANTERSGEQRDAPMRPDQPNEMQTPKREAAI